MKYEEEGVTVTTVTNKAKYCGLQEQEIKMKMMLLMMFMMGMMKLLKYF